MTKYRFKILSITIGTRVISDVNADAQTLDSEEDSSKRSKHVYQILR